MPSITVEKLTFELPTSYAVKQYDEWSFFKKQFQRIAPGTKAVDFLALFSDDEGRVLWLVEVKDYRRHRRTKSVGVADEVAMKVRDSLAGLFAAATQANDAAERAFAATALATRQLRVVLHLEQPEKPSRQFPRDINLANVKMMLKQLVKAVDPHPVVSDMNRPGPVPWTVNSAT